MKTSLPGEKLSRIIQDLKLLAVSPRWRKVLADLKGNKARTTLVILSIAVGVFAVGYVNGSVSLVLQDMDFDYNAANAHAAIIYTDTFGKSLITSLQEVTGVGAVEGRTSIDTRIIGNGGNKLPITLTALPELDQMKIDKLTTAEPGDTLNLNDKEVLIEQSSLSGVTVKRGDTVQVVLTSGKIRELKVAGVVHDVTGIPFSFSGSVNGFVNLRTMEWLGGRTDFNTVYLTVAEDKTNQRHVEDIARQVADKIEKGGIHVYGNFIYQPGRHFASDISKSLGQIMGILSTLSVFLSVFLVINTISSLLTQQIRQIGIMKSVGARSLQVSWMYLGLVTAFGVLAFLIAVPLSASIGFITATYLARYLNFRLLNFRIPGMAILQEIFVALIIPVAASFVPVVQGSRLTIREAISNYGLGTGNFGGNFIDRIIGKIKGGSRPLLISLRNSIRRKGRLVLTLSTLTLAGAIFIGVFNLREAFDITIKKTYGYYLSDVVVTFSRNYHLEQVTRVFQSVPNVVSAESWGRKIADLLSPDKHTSTQIGIIAPPSGSKLIKATITGGRWLVPEDENALVIGNHLLKVRPDIKVGDKVNLKINGKETAWNVIGIYEMAGNVSNPIVYTNQEYLAKITRQPPGLISNLRVVTHPQDSATQEQVASALENGFAAAGVKTYEIVTGTQTAARSTSQTNILVYFLLAMSVLIALVGGLGLSGTMGMNVMERTREIGVMRAIGASDQQVAMLVLVEGMLVGFVSWIFAVILAVPISYLLDYVVGINFVQSPLNFVFSYSGLTIWLVGVLVISGAASYLPARNATRLTVREILSYE